MSYVAAASVGMIGIASLMAWIGFSLTETQIFQIKDKVINANEFRPLFFLLSVIFMASSLILIRNLILDVGVTNFAFDQNLIWIIIALLWLLVILLAFLIIRFVLKIIGMLTNKKDVLSKTL